MIWGGGSQKCHILIECLMQHNHDGQRKGKHIKTCRSQVLNVNNPWCTDEDYKLLEPSGIRSLIHLIESAMGNSF